MQKPEDLGKFVGPIMAACKAQFPRVCSNCKREFPDFKDFIEHTVPVGAPQLPHGEDDPIGLISYVNCKCGSTIILECNDAQAHKNMVAALSEETRVNGQSVRDLLLQIRAEVRRRILEE
jgi:hypothetical protein